VLADVLAGGRTSRLYKRLVETEKALTVQTGGFFKEYPGGKYQNQFVIFGAPNRGISVDSVEQAIYDELDDIKENGVTTEELERAKTRARSNLIGELDSNLGLARQFAEAEALTRDWRTVFRKLNEIESVTAEDVQRVASDTFERTSRTVALIETPKNEEQSMASAN
jgi:predicted Zn-dependent peptidase